MKGGKIMSVGKVNLDEIKKIYEKVKNEMNGGNQFFKFEEGSSKVALMPPRKGSSTFFVRGNIHFVRLDEEIVTLRCRRDIGKICPLCDTLELLMRKNKIKKEKYQALKARHRIYIAIVDRKNPGAGVQIAPIGRTIFEAILSIFANPDWGDITDPNNARDLVIRREGTSRYNTKYFVEPSPKKRTLKKKWLKNIPDLEKALPKIKSRKFVKKITKKLLGVCANGKKKEK